MQKGSKATVIAVSVMLDDVMEVCHDQDVTILYYTTLEPFDRETLANNCQNGKILVCEPEYEGSLLYDIYKSLPGKALKIEQVAFPREIFRNYGTYKEKLNHYGLTKTNIRYKLERLIGE
jgi:transketolase